MANRKSFYGSVTAAQSGLRACLDEMVPFRWPIQMTISFRFEKV